jgi:hypothetical protein
MKAWWKRATRAKTATELTGAEIKRLAAELQVVAGRRGVTTGAAVTAIATALGNEVAALVMRNPKTKYQTWCANQCARWPCSRSSSVARCPER